MKLPKALPLLLATLVMSSSVSAQTALFGSLSATKDVTVDATLASACVFDSATALELTAAYPAFSADAVEPKGNVTVRCTRGGDTPSIGFGGGDLGVVGGLFFQLSATWSQTDAGSEPTGALNNIGAPRTGQFEVKASFPPNQAGTTGTTVPVTKEMTLTF